MFGRHRPAPRSLSGDIALEHDTLRLAAQIEELAESRHLRRDVGVDCASQPRPRADRRRWLWF